MANSNGAESNGKPDIQPDAAPDMAEKTQQDQADNFQELQPMNTRAPFQEERKHAIGKRSTGLWLYDFLLYPVLNNTTVFLTSVAATYLSIKGGSKGADGKPLFGKVGELFHKRSQSLDKGFQSLSMGKEAAENSRIVALSFLDGSILAVPVKWMENKRQSVSRGLDSALGTTPTHESVYENEPKQTWLSVLGGRVATAAIVVSTALVFERTHVKDKNGEVVNINKKMFKGGANWLEAKIKAIPALKRFFEKPAIADKIELNTLSYVAVFEAVYTSICTVGLWIGSRTIAALQGNWNSNPKSLPAPTSKPTPELPKAPEPIDTGPVVANNDTLRRDNDNEKPTPKVANITRENTLAPDQGMALGAS